MYHISQHVFVLFWDTVSCCASNSKQYIAVDCTTSDDSVCTI